jgi:hypothetical protein
MYQMQTFMYLSIKLVIARNVVGRGKFSKPVLFPDHRRKASIHDIARPMVLFVVDGNDVYSWMLQGTKTLLSRLSSQQLCERIRFSPIGAYSFIQSDYKIR